MSDKRDTEFVIKVPYLLITSSFILLLFLKLTDASVIELPWYVIFLPLYILPLVLGIGFIVGVLVLTIYELIVESIDKKKDVPPKPPTLRKL